ncbi:ferritin-like domain-containing protein [Paludisphaera mucosa]|uniref:Ferritin-like domain-containing protein n=1 Tax=Paludisphaera mucosa TaxID=3030827 RepID=A0ABT6FLK2_9BACT|nr:ferritin-like domain-containing protein [Paludisphaera mucosa]MDG3008399.1 ferritin-like domain-containing protein [Paludisphaera mucosa]
MFETMNDLALEVRGRFIGLLNARLADCVDLQTQVKHAHWNVKGRDFIALHELFDEINEAVEDYVDDIAERAVQLGGVAQGTADLFTEVSRGLDKWLWFVESHAQSRP